MSVSLLGVGSVGIAAEDRAPGDSPGAFLLSLDIPTPEFTSGHGGTFRITAPGYGPYSTEPGQPNLPVRTFRVAIPADADPQLHYSLGARQVFPGRVPEPHPRMYEADGDPDRRLRRTVGFTELGKSGRSQRVFEYLRDADVYAGSELWPQAVVWLGQTGYLRYQRFVDVHVAPYRWDPVRGELIVQQEVEFRVDFNSAGTLPQDPSPARDSEIFERVYREAFVNGDDSGRFRIIPESTSLTENSRSFFPGARRKILVRADGVVRLDFNRMNGSGFIVEPISTWRLESRGVPVPLDTNDDGDDLLEPGEWVQFYGQALDEEPHTELNLDLVNTDIDLFEARDFGDENVYFLTVAGVAQALMPIDDGTPNMVNTPPTSFRATAHAEEDSEFGYRPLGAADPWYWLPTLSTEPTLPSERTESIALPGLASTTSDLDVRVRIRGITEDFGTDPDHNTRLTLQDSGGQLLTSDQQFFDGRSIFDFDFTWVFPGMGAQLTDPVEIKLEVLTVVGIRNDVILNEIDLTYDRTFTAMGGSLTFDWIDEEQDFVISGLNDPTPEILEITTLDGEEIIATRRIDNATVSGAGPYTVRFTIGNRGDVTDGTPRKFIIYENSATVIPGDADFFDDAVSDLRDNMIQADYIVIAADDVLDDAPGSPLDLLLDWRATTAGGGLTSKIARYSDIVDEFNDGIEGPDAIESFLRWVMSTAPGEGWANPRPTYVLLLGDGSFDYKGGPAQGNVLPTQIVFKDVFELGYYASDNLLAAVVGSDSIPDLLIGRIPARTTMIANRVLSKILDYEQTPAGGTWNRHVLTISDQGKTDNNPAEALQFEMINTDSVAALQGQGYTETHLRFWTDYIDPGVGDATNMRADIKAEVNGTGGVADGAAITQYVGHGNFVVWSDSAFFDERSPAFDTQDLFNGLRLPLVTAHNCLTGGFHVPFAETLGEAWLKRDGGGGIAVLAPSSLSFVFVGEVAAAQIWEGAFGLAKKRIVGELALDIALALCGQGPGTVDSCQAYTLQGDPATRLQLPDVAPPSNLNATGGNAQVQLDWSPSPDMGVTYDVYRATALVGIEAGYSKQNMTPLMTPQFIDINVINADEYFYYVLAVESGGFESAASNRNTDCGGAEMDCVRVTPLNPGPPTVPTGLTVTDPGTGNLLFLDWSPNPENDLDFYTLHWGTETGVYPNSVPLIPIPTTTVPGLVSGQDYFFVVTATNTSTHTSSPSAEVTDFPIFSEGLRSPRYIDDLVVTVNGTDLDLDWSEITTSIFGKPITVDHYDILRGLSPPYGNGSLAKIGECMAPCVGFTDATAATGMENWQYRVQAISVDGNGSGLGAELPASVMLSLDKSLTPGEVLLTWPAITLTTTGDAALLAGYEIYLGDSPFTREAIRDGMVLPFASTTETVFPLTPPLQNRFYSVLAIDIYGNRSPF